MGRGYGVADMSYYLYNALNVTYKNKITYYQSYDIVNYTTASAPYRITSVTIRKFNKNWSTGIESYASDTLKLNSSVFIDASQEGRLARKVNSVATVGRCDWTAERLKRLNEYGEYEETLDYKDFTENETSVGKQQAATLMVMMNKIKAGDKIPNDGMTVNNTPNGAALTMDMEWTDYKFNVTGFPPKRECMAWGGTETVRYAQEHAPAIDHFNETYGTSVPGVRPGMYIKPLNAARDGYSSENWWVNALLIFDVDGRAHEKDKGTAFYPNDMLSDSWNVDDAWRAVRNCLNNDETFRIRLRKAICTMPGFEDADFVTDPLHGGYRVGDTLYLRETIHMSESNVAVKQGTENSNYAVTAYECRDAGTGNSSSDKDYGNKATRIGLAIYQSDIHPYRIEHILSDGEYIYGETGYELIRDDIKDPAHPVYLPFSVMTTHYVSNLFLAGYAINASSYAWGELRVFPNLCTIGDAAGIAAAYAAKNGLTALQIGENSTHIANVQSRLRVYGARLDK